MASSGWSGRTLGVIGGGNMAEALIRGVLSSGLLPAASVTVFDILPARRKVFADLGCTAAESASTAAGADAVLIATKPQTMREALSGSAARDDQLFISIAAGIPSRVIEDMLGGGARVVRVMPNTPLLVGAGMAAVCGGAKARPDDVELAVALFSCCGRAVRVDESLMDAVTALSGSGPAYLFRFAETLMAGGEKLGLAPDLARELTIGMLEGSAKMLTQNSDAARLRENVTSPGGTTAAALNVFEERGFPGLVADAMKAARDRGVELGRDQ